MALLQQHELECDVLVAGGGPAGVPAALAAARNGARVILCQDRPVLGGNASSEIRMHIVGADKHGSRGKNAPLSIETREGGIMEEIRLELGIKNPNRCGQMLDLVLYDKCRMEPHITLMLNTRVTDAIVQNQRITHAIAERASTEDRFRIAASVFIDATGDGGLGASAGASFRHGRESKADFGEKYAQPAADEQTLGSSLLLTAKKYDYPIQFVAPKWARKFEPSQFKLRRITSYEYGFWWLEWGGQLNTIKDNEKIRDELLAIMLGVWDYIKNSGQHPESENWAMDWFGWVPGKRESRRFIGQHIFREQDILQNTIKEDAIAYGGWAIDIHPPSGIDVPDKPPFTPYPVPYIYNIPLRACISKDIANLMFAGRNISATHVAFASTRVMATCAVIGQGVGTAAAYALKNRLLPSQLVANKPVMKAIQQQLLRDDCYLVGIKNEDPLDLSFKAKVTASSAQDEGKPENIQTGQTRSVHGKAGAPPDQAFPGTHRWMSDPKAGLPAWIALKWDKPVMVAEVQLIFDTGMHRQLTQSQSDSTMASQIWGRPQPETVRDYVLEAMINGKWTEIARESGNYMRRVVHRIEKNVSTDQLRVTVTATNGLDHARIFEMRVYEA